MTDVLDRAVAGTGLVPAFQRVVSLPSEAVVGYEALARWPTLDNPAPVDILRYAEQTGRLSLLDDACIKAAAHGAVHGGSTPGMLLLVNCEPSTADVPAADPDVMAAAKSFRLTFELTERGLLTNPSRLLRKVAALRAAGFAVALDDIGAHPDSLALLDIVAPEIMKLDMRLVQRQPDRVQARTVAAVVAHHERTGAVICAEGIENDEHLEQALAYGATLGQGNRFGLPGPLTPVPRTPSIPPTSPYSAMDTRHSTFEAATAGLAIRAVRKKTIIELTDHFLRLAASAESAPIVLATIHPSDRARRISRQRCETIAERSPLIAVLGSGLDTTFESHVRCIALAPDDPLARESTLIVLGPDTAAGLIARKRDWSAGDGEELYDMALTFDRDRVTIAARGLLERIN